MRHQSLVIQISLFSFFNNGNMCSPCPDFAFAFEIYVASTSDLRPVSERRLESPTSAFTFSSHFSCESVCKALRLAANAPTAGNARECRQIVFRWRSELAVKLKSPHSLTCQNSQIRTYVAFQSCKFFLFLEHHSKIIWSINAYNINNIILARKTHLWQARPWPHTQRVGMAMRKPEQVGTPTPHMLLSWPLEMPALTFDSAFQCLLLLLSVDISRSLQTYNISVSNC